MHEIKKNMWFGQFKNGYLIVELPRNEAVKQGATSASECVAVRCLSNVGESRQ